MGTKSRTTRNSRTQKKTSKDIKRNKKRRFKFKAISMFIILIFLVLIIIKGIIATPVTNIYISGNKLLSDQEIIDIAKLTDYPSTFKNPAILLEKRLKSNNLIYDAEVKKKRLTKVYIEVKENKPLFYNSSSGETVLFDKTVVDRYLNSAILINYVPDTIYDSFINAMAKLNDEVLQRISEIKYDPNDVDEERFLLMMDDSNYVYLTISKFISLNNYVSIIKNFDSKKGILYLDSGEYFQILEN